MRYRPLALAALLAAPLAAQTTHERASSPFAHLPDSLPPGFPGESFAGLYKRFILAPKGEFETSAAFAARRRPPVDTLWHAIPVGSSCTTTSFIYDADHQRFIVTMEDANRTGTTTSTENSSLIKALDSYVEGICVSRRSTVVRTYKISNAFGATATVTESMLTDEIIQTPALWAAGTLLGSVAVPAERAADVKPRLGFVVFFRLADSARLLTAGDWYQHIEPTLPEPTEVLYDGRFIQSREYMVAVWNRSTGKIYCWIGRCGNEP